MSRVSIALKRLTLSALFGVTINLSLNNCQPQPPVSAPVVEVKDSDNSDSGIYSDITYADFLRMEKTGKPLGEIEAVFGKGEKTQGSADRDIYRWRLRNGGWVVGTFDKEERLINLNQHGLVNR